MFRVKLKNEFTKNLDFYNQPSELGEICIFIFLSEKPTQVKSLRITLQRKPNNRLI